MTTAAAMKHRPWVTTTAFTLVAAIALLVVPISYERTTGHEVTLAVSGAVLDAAHVQGIAKGLESALPGATVKATMTADGGSDALTFTAFVPGGSRAAAATAAQTIARSLNEKGYRASAAVRDVKEKVSGSVYAYAQDQVIRISTDGKSAAQLESDIRQAFAAAGVPDAVVSVTDEIADGKPARKVTVEVNREGKAGSPGEFEAKLGAEPKIVLTKDGQVLPGADSGVRVFKRRTPTGVTTTVEVVSAGRTVKAEVPNSDKLSDAELTSALEAQLFQAGVPSRVKIDGNRIAVEPVK